MLGSNNEDSSSDDSAASGYSAAKLDRAVPSNTTTPEQGSATMTTTKDGEDRSTVEDGEEVTTDTTRQQIGDGQNQLPEFDRDRRGSKAKYEGNLHAAQLLKSFDHDSKRFHLSHMLKGLKTYSNNRFDSRGLEEIITDTARQRMEETSSLLAYVDSLEMKLIHLQSQMRVSNQEDEAHRLETMDPIKDCQCLFCQTSRLEEPTSVASKPDETSSTATPLESQEPWIKEVRRQMRYKDDYGDVRTGALDEDILAGRKGITGRTGGPIMTHYRNFAGDSFDNQLEIHSPLLIEALRAAIGHYAGDAWQVLKGDTVIFDEPYMMLFHNRKKLVDHAANIADEAKDHLLYLLDFLRQELPHVGRKLDEIEQKSCKTIDFSTLWLLYQPPGTVVYTRVSQEWRAFRIASLGGFKQQANGVRSELSLKKIWMYINAFEDGLVSRLGYASIANFDDEQLISTLQFIPQGYLPDEAAIREQLIARGETCWNFRGKANFLDYIGNAWPKNMQSDAMRVIVDYNKDGSTEGEDEGSNGPAVPGCDCRDCRKRRGATELDSPSADIEFTAATIHDIANHPEKTLLLLPPTIRAFSLRKKDWRNVEIANLRPVQFETEAFKRLVIKKPHRNLVTAMSKSYFTKDSNFADLVKGKGRGLIILLHGSPGTGKTLTAECVAEEEQKPLYMITCGDLGTEAADLESKLRSVFDDATRWGAVLLLDEADVFLQERDVRDLKRNALVSVFLRELEYFDGILFLTTNRPGLLDEAFQSRIHLTLHLEDLTTNYQLKIWLIFLQEQKLNPEEMEHIFRELQKMYESRKETLNGRQIEIPKENLNGRQIRNSIRTATALAAAEKKKLSAAHIKTVLEVGKQFANYRKTLDGMDSRDRQAALGLRLSA